MLKSLDLNDLKKEFGTNFRSKNSALRMIDNTITELEAEDPRAALKLLEGFKLTDREKQIVAKKVEHNNLDNHLDLDTYGVLAAINLIKRNYRYHISADEFATYTQVVRGVIQVRLMEAKILK